MGQKKIFVESNKILFQQQKFDFFEQLCLNDLNATEATKYFYFPNQTDFLYTYKNVFSLIFYFYEKRVIKLTKLFSSKG